MELNETVNLKKLGDATLVMRNDNAAIYKRDENIYEVFKRRYGKERTVTYPNGNTVTYPAGELYPSDEAFGVWAWCFTTLEDAEKIFNTINIDK